MAILFGYSMAVRIRKDGSIVCAAMFPKQEDDLYIDDRLHYYLAVEIGILVTDEYHLEHGKWWWKDTKTLRN